MFPPSKVSVPEMEIYALYGKRVDTGSLSNSP